MSVPFYDVGYPLRVSTVSDCEESGEGGIEAERVKNMGSSEPGQVINHSKLQFPHS